MKIPHCSHAVAKLQQLHCSPTDLTFLYRRGVQQSMNRADEESNHYIAQTQQER